MKRIRQQLAIVLLVSLAIVCALFAGFFIVFGVGRFCDQPVNFKYFDVPGEIMSEGYRRSEAYERNHFLRDGKEYESRAFIQYRLLCKKPNLFEVDEIIAFRDSESNVVIGKIVEIQDGGYKVLTELGEFVIQRNQIIARD